MLAILLALGLLLFWAALGWALISTLEVDRDPLQSLLISPAIGIACTLLPSFWLNGLAGLPVESFGRYLALALCFFIVLAWIKRRPTWSWRELIFFAPVIGGIILIGFPMFDFGFDWVANANDDWANYNLGAMRHLTAGLYQQPSIDMMKMGRDYPSFFWFFEVAADARPGSELMLAWLSATIGKNPFFIFMPIIVAFHGALCFAIAAMAQSSFRGRSGLLAATTLIAVAPLNLYAVHQQLIAQVVGLSLMGTVASLTFVPLRSFKSRGHIALTTIAVAAYWLVYPESVPFFGLTFLIFHASHARTKDWGWDSAWKLAVPPAAACILLGPYTASFIFYTLRQIHHSGENGVYNGTSIFPYFLVPSGLAVLFGFSKLGELMPEPWLTTSIAGAIVCCIISIVGVVLGLRQKNAVAFYAAVFATVTAILLAQHNDFGVFKIAMFAQFAVLVSLVLVLSRLRPILGGSLYLLILLTATTTDLKYTRAALDDSISTANYIPGASRGRLLTSLLVNGPNRPCDVNMGSANPPLIKLWAAAKGCGTVFPASARVFGDVANEISQFYVNSNPLHGLTGVVQFSQRAAAQITERQTEIRFPAKADIKADVIVRLARPIFEYEKTIGINEENSIFNDFGSPDGNRLIFVNSSLGGYYYAPGFGGITVFQAEPDFFFPRGKVSGIGRYLLLRLVSPLPARIVLDVTSSLMGDGIDRLPPASILGQAPVEVGLTGNGAARVISPEFLPVVVDGVPYVLLDLGTDAKIRPVLRSGLMALYGRDVDLDYRRVVTFARQIRLANANDIASSNIPTSINKFPNDLGDVALQFSGIYEDGWIGNDGFVVLRSDERSRVVFRGFFPNDIGLDAVDLILQVGSDAPVAKHLRPGNFEVEAPISVGVSKISFHFSAAGRLPHGDNRPVDALLSSVRTSRAVTP